MPSDMKLVKKMDMAKASQFRCFVCRRLLALIGDQASIVEVKCPKCKTVMLYSQGEVKVVRPGR